MLKANPKAGFLSAYFLFGFILFESCQCWSGLAQRKRNYWGYFYMCNGIMLGTVQTRQQRKVQLSQLHPPLDIDQPSPENLISSCGFYLFIHYFVLQTLQDFSSMEKTAWLQAKSCCNSGSVCYSLEIEHFMTLLKILVVEAIPNPTRFESHWYICSFCFCPFLYFSLQCFSLDLKCVQQ